MKKALSIMALLAGVSMVTDAQAEERWPRWYIGLNGGLSIHQDANVDGTGILSGGELSFEDGYRAGVALGYQPAFMDGFLSNLRVEAEVSFMGNDLENYTAGGVSTPVTGDISTVAYMANAYYDFPTSMAITPYIGAGVGIANVELDLGSGVSDDDNLFAYQFMAGIGYAPEMLPMTEFSLGYRYFGSGATGYTAIGDVENDTHNVEAGVKLRF